MRLLNHLEKLEFKSTYIQNMRDNLENCHFFTLYPLVRKFFLMIEGLFIFGYTIDAFRDYLQKEKYSPLLSILNDISSHLMRPISLKRL
jgi:hypothetical protein